MDGRASTFKKALADFEQRLASAEYVAIDTELTGVDLEGEPDTFEESAAIRLEKICRIAERYTLIQLGLTVVSRQPDAPEGTYTCASYNLFAFPYVGPELGGREPGFFCQASALQFNAQHRVNFNTWIKEGVPYMSREEEKRYLESGPEENHVDEKAGLLRLWKVLCDAQLPFVVHCPLDLFFLLAAFERRPLPWNDPRALAMLIRKCTPKVYDTAHLHGALGRFKRLGLMKFFEDAQARYEELASNSLGNVPNIEFELRGETAGRYSKRADDLAHEAGFDSLVTAQLFAYLRSIAPGQVKENVNRLFLYRSVDFIDLDRAVKEGVVGTCMFDLSRVTLLVAALDMKEGLDAPRQIAACGFTYKWMDNTHLLVVLRASGGAAVRKAAELAAKVHGVVSWCGFEEWRQLQVVRATDERARRRALGNGRGVSPLPDRDLADGLVDNAELSNGGHEASCSPQTATNGCSLRELSTSVEVCERGGGVHTSWVFRLLAAGAAGLLVMLTARARHQISAVAWRWRNK